MGSLGPVVVVAAGEHDAGLSQRTISSAVFQIAQSSFDDPKLLQSLFEMPALPGTDEGRKARWPGRR